MTYEKTWVDNEKLNKTELKKLEKDGLEVFDAIPYYAENGFASIPKAEWDSFKWAGLYLQRPKEEGYFMMRVNVPSGVLSFEQAEALAQISNEYGRGVFDVTTRQAIQFHWLRIEDIPSIFYKLERVRLSTAGACGDINRNIVGNPLAGIDPNELFDTEPIVQEIYEYFQHNKDFSNLPRKFKMSISANVHNASNAEINCVSFTPAIKKIDHEKVNGFHVKVGGGLSASPKLAESLDVFVRPNQVKQIAIALTKIFRDYGYREKRHRARFKFLVADWGPELVKAKLQEYTGPLHSKGVDQQKDWNAGYFYGVHKQTQKGLNYIGLNVPVGRLHADEVLEIALISNEYGNGEIRTCNSQNIIIPNVPDELLAPLLQEEIFERITIEPRRFMAYSVSCTGIEFCNLALVETKERMRRIAKYLDEQIALDVPVRLHMVGCPNSCGQRQIADIGLQGIKMKSRDKKLIEAFEIYVGGTLQQGGNFNEKLKGKVAADHLEPVLRALLVYFKNIKKPGESFFDFFNRVGVASFQHQFDLILEKETIPVS